MGTNPDHSEPRTGGAASPSTVSLRAPAPAHSLDLADAVWRFCCSIRLALVLILLIALASFVGTLMIQAPGGLAAEDYLSWLDQARLKYGSWTGLFDALQLFNVFGSFWFRLLLVLLMVNVTACTVNRWNGIWRSISRPRVRTGEGFFRQSSTGTHIPAPGMSVSDVSEGLQSLLRAKRYRVLTQESAATVHLYADRNRYGKLGTFLSHLSLLLLMAGVILGSAFGFRNSEFVVPEGSTRDVGFGTGLTVKCESFVDEYYPEGPPKDYRSELVLYENGQPVKSQVVRVNEPMDYKGIRFYQAFFGPAAVVDVTDDTGKSLYNDGVALAFDVQGRPAGAFTLPDRGLMVVLVGPMSGALDPSIGAGQVRVQIYQSKSQTLVGSDMLTLDQPTAIGGLTYTFKRERQFTGLQVVRDPGVWLIWVASTLMVVGLVMVFYFPHRRLWARCQKDGDGESEIWMAAMVRRDLTFAREFQLLANTVRDKIGQAHRGSVSPTEGQLA